MVFFVVLNLIKSYCYFEANTSGNFLLFSLVEPQNSSFIGGLKSFVSVFLKAVAFFTAYKAAYYPEYFSPPVVVLMLILAQILIYRKHIYLRDG